MVDVNDGALERLEDGESLDTGDAVGDADAAERVDDALAYAVSVDVGESACDALAASDGR